MENVYGKINRFQRAGYATIIVFTIAFIIFSGFLIFSVKTDIQTHVRWVSSIAHGDRTPRPNFLYQLLVYVVSFFHKEYLPLYFGSVLLLSVAVAAKFVISHHYVVGIAFSSFDRPGFVGANFFFQITFIASIMLVFVFSLPLTVLLGGDFYLTNFPPNIWHNPTTILLMPFALILFLVSYTQIKEPTNKRILLISALCVVNVLIKPSFFLVFCIAFPLFFFLRHGFKKAFWINLVPIVIGILIVIAEYYFLYVSTGFSDSDGSVAIDLLTVWSHYSPSVILSFIGSIFFPLIFIVLYPKLVIKNDLFYYAASLFLISVIMFSVLIETGDRKFDGNFGWQYIITNYFLYLVVISTFLKNLVEKNQFTELKYAILLRQLIWKDITVLIVFVFQFILGIYYVFRFFL